MGGIFDVLISQVQGNMPGGIGFVEQPQAAFPGSFHHPEGESLIVAFFHRGIEEIIIKRSGHTPFSLAGKAAEKPQIQLRAQPVAVGKIDPLKIVAQVMPDLLVAVEVFIPHRSGDIISAVAHLGVFQIEQAVGGAQRPGPVQAEEQTVFIRLQVPGSLAVDLNIIQHDLPINLQVGPQVEIPVDIVEQVSLGSTRFLIDVVGIIKRYRVDEPQLPLACFPAVQYDFGGPEMYFIPQIKAYPVAV